MELIRDCVKVILTEERLCQGAIADLNFFQSHDLHRSFSSFHQVDLKPCRRHLNRVESIIFPSKFRPFIPLCDSNGYYLPLQCHQSSGYCWCVNKNGNMKSGTRTKGPIDCGKYSCNIVVERKSK